MYEWHARSARHPSLTSFLWVALADQPKPPDEIEETTRDSEKMARVVIRSPFANRVSLVRVDQPLQAERLIVLMQYRPGLLSLQRITQVNVSHQFTNEWSRTGFRCAMKSCSSTETDAATALADSHTYTQHVEFFRSFAALESDPSRLPQLLGKMDALKVALLGYGRDESEYAFQLLRRLFQIEQILLFLRVKVFGACSISATMFKANA